MTGLNVERRLHNGILAYLGAAIAQTGIQLIGPALPAMRDALALTDAEVGLVMSAYLLPAAPAAVISGLIADRVGRRLTFGWSMIGFGLCGLLVPFLGGSIPLLLSVRFVQGVFFGGLLPLTITIIGDVFSGSDLVGAHGRRSLSMRISDGAWPVIGGFAAGLAWWLPWLGQMSAIVLGVWALVKLVEPVHRPVRQKLSAKGRLLASLFIKPSIVAFEVIGFVRLFVKFAGLTYLPVFLVDERGLSVSQVGLLLGVGALAGTATAAATKRLATLGGPTVWTAVGCVGMGASLIALILVPSHVVIVVASVTYGITDTLLTVFVNAYVSIASETDIRATFVAATGALRNLAKFLGPLTVAVLTLSVSIGTAFLITGVALMATVSLTPLLRVYNAALVRT